MATYCFKAKVYSSIVGYRAKLELVMKNDGLIVARIPGSPVDIPSCYFDESTWIRI